MFNPYDETLEDKDVAIARRIIAQRLSNEINNSVFVKLLLDNAEADARAAMERLVTVNPLDSNAIMLLQNQVRRARDIAMWVTSVLSAGDIADEMLADDQEVVSA